MTHDLIASGLGKSTHAELVRDVLLLRAQKDVLRDTLMNIACMDIARKDTGGGRYSDGWAAAAIAAADVARAGLAGRAPSPARAAADESDRCDYEISDDGVMTATIGWQRDNDATALRLLACHSVDVPDHVIALWTDEQVKEADIWAWSCALSASDHDDIQVPPRPAFLPNTRSSLMRHPITGEPL